MFWQFENWSVTQIDKIIESPDVTLGQVIAEDDVIQECKSQNMKLLQYLTQPDIMHQMLQLIITVPDESIEPNIRFKSANVVCELLTCELDLMNDGLMAQENMETLYSFIATTNVEDGESKTKEQLNPLLASFVSKAFCVLIKHRPQELLEFLKTKDSFVEDILSHIEVSAMADLLIRLITGIKDELEETRNAVIAWLSEKRLVPRLVECLGKNADPESQSNATQLVCDVIKICREQQSQMQEKASPNPLLEEIESSETVDKILQTMFETNTEAAIVQGILILQSLIEYKRHNANLNQPPAGVVDENPDEGIPPPNIQQQVVFGQNRPENPVNLVSVDVVSALDAQRLAQSVCQVHAAVIPRLSQLHEFLVTEPPVRPILTTIGVIERPLGMARIEAVHFIRALLSSNNPAINRALASLKTISILINLFFKYPWNSFLHIQVEHSIKLMFDNSKASSPVTSPTEEEAAEGRDSSFQEAAILLVQELIQESGIIKEIPDMWSKYNEKVEGSDIEVPVAQEPRPGFMGHLVKIANDINDAASADENIKALFQALPPETIECWDMFVHNSLEKVNARMKTPLVPEVPVSFEEATHRQETALHQRFFQYQMQMMSKNDGFASDMMTLQRDICNEFGINNSNFSEPDVPSISSKADQLSKINFDLEAQMASMEQTDNDQGDQQQCVQTDGTRVEHSSSDEEDDLFNDKGNEKATHDMDVDPPSNIWPTPVLTSESDTWSGSNDANHASHSSCVEGWANFGSFSEAATAMESQVSTHEVSDSSVCVSVIQRQTSNVWQEVKPPQEEVAAINQEASQDGNIE